MRRRRGRRGIGARLLIGVAVLLAAAAVVGLVLAAVARHQVKTAEPIRMSDHVSPPTRSGPEGLVRLDLDVAFGSLVVVPGAAGEPLRVETEHDDARHEITHAFDPGARGGGVLRVVSRPRGSRAMALLRMKLGGELPEVRLTLPPDVRFAIVGRMEGGLAAVEIGGLDVASVDLEASNGAAILSVAEPTRGQVESLRVVGRTGSVKVVGVGNASPREATFSQRLGEIDLDLRGAWWRDAHVAVEVEGAGGTAWLPAEGVDLVTTGGTPVAPVEGSSVSDVEVRVPRITFDVEERGGRLVIVR